MDDIRVLIVDDSSMMRNLIGKIVDSTEGLMVADKAMNGRFALQKLDRVDPDAIVLDIEMPEMNGLELVKKVRAEQKYVDMPIIMVTTEGGKAEVITALKAGVNNYIVKPFTPQVLKEKLEDVLG